MADEKPKTGSVTYKQVVKAVGPGALETWRKIGHIADAGEVPLNADGNASISLTGVSDAKRGQIERLISRVEEEVEAQVEAKSNKKEK